MKGLLLLIAILILGLAVSGQAPTPKPMATPTPKVTPTAPKVETGKCELIRATAPAVRGLRLGMTESEVSDVLGGGLKFSDDSENWTRSTVLLPKYANGIDGFEDIKSIHIDTYEGEVSDIQLTYDVKWNSLKEFVDNFSPKLGVPRAAWQPHILGARAQCKGFDIVLMGTFMDSGIQLSDTLVKKEIEDRKLKAANDKKNAIKP